MQLTERIHLIGSGRGGLRISHPLDCNMFLVDGGTEAAIIDAGCGIEPERIVRHIQNSGVAMEKVSTLLLTHAHGDHVAGARFWHEEFGLKIVCATEARPWVETGDQEKTSLRIAREGGVYPLDFEFHPCPVAHDVGDGDEIQIGDITLEVLETPGHARGHIVFLWQQDDGTKVLLGGDVCFPGGRIAPQITWDFSTEEYAATMRRLDGLKIDQLFAGHGAPLLSEAHLDIEIAHKAFSRFALPATF